jgi:stage II sporulation protein D
MTFRHNLILLLPVFAVFLSSCMPRAGKAPLLAGPDIRVLLGSITDRDTLIFDTDYYLRSEEAEYEFGSRNRSITVRTLTGGLQLFNENRNLLYRDRFPVVLKPADGAGRFRFRGGQYEGTLILQAAENSTVLVINLINVESYLKGVVPAEIFSIRDEDLQAVKAQAICARTYALKHIAEKKDKYFDLTSGTSDQVYGGYARHTTLADQAVEDTRGVVITDKDTLATVYYHSTCGGETEAGNNVFPIGETSYLKTAPDIIGDRFACSFSPYFRWTETRTIEQLDSALQVHYNLTYLQDLVSDTTTVRFTAQVTRRSSGGRVQEMTLSLGDTILVLSGYEIRRFLALPPDRYLKSNLFYLDPLNDSTLVIHGAGFGHGVGLCQYGALGMSREGLQYFHILHKYFPTTVLTKKY